MWHIILLLITTIYLLNNFVISQYIGGFVGSYIVKPALWITLVTMVFLTAKNEGVNIWQFRRVRRWQIGKTPFQAALLIGSFQVSLLIIAGLISGFGRNPVSFTPLMILINLTYVTTSLFAVELSRTYLIKKGATRKKNINRSLILVTLLFTMIAIPFAKTSLLTSGDKLEILKFLGETLIPTLAMSLFASYMAFLGGAKAAIGYMGALQMFTWFSPVLPDLEWITAGLIGTIAPAIGFIIIQDSIETTYQRIKKGFYKKNRDPTLGWTGIAVLAVLFIFFSFGYLGVQPTVIYSGSMQPTLQVGDLVIIKKTPIDTLQKGDIIQYIKQNTSIPIVHRIHNIINKDGTKLYITKGDANNAPDSTPVHPKQITGKSIIIIPKIGWVSITVKSLIKTFIPTKKIPLY